MYNYCTDQNEIRKAVATGLIDLKDFQEYQRITNSSEVLKKGLEQKALTPLQYEVAVSHSDKCEFVKSNEGGRLRYKLNVIKGERPSEEFKKSIVTSALSGNGKSQRPYVRSTSYAVPASVTRVVNEITEMAEKIQRKRRK